MFRSIDIMIQIYYEGIYFGCQYFLYPANNSSWVRHTKVILWAIGVNAKSRAHLAIPPFPNPGGFRQCQKGLLHT